MIAGEAEKTDSIHDQCADEIGRDGTRYPTTLQDELIPGTETESFVECRSLTLSALHMKAAGRADIIVHNKNRSALTNEGKKHPHHNSLPVRALYKHLLPCGFESTIHLGLLLHLIELPSSIFLIRVTGISVKI